MIPQYTLIRSKRKTLALQITIKGDIVLRAPMKMRESYIERFITSKLSWITKHTTRIKTSHQETKNYTESEKKEMKKKLLPYITKRIKELCDEKNITPPTGIKITASERRWGSCSHKNRLCFSYRLAEYLDVSLSSRRDPFQNQVWRENDLNLFSEWKSDSSTTLRNDKTQFIDAIIIHELAHTREKNHQKPFWDLVYAWMPEYEENIKTRD